MLSFKSILVLAVHCQLFSFIVLLRVLVYQETGLGWIINKKSEKVKTFNHTLALNKQTNK